MTNALPPVTVVMTTWAPAGNVGTSRVKSAVRALTSWTWQLDYDGPLRLHIADDGSDLDVPGALAPIAHKAGWDVTCTRQERRGVGASLNAGFEAAWQHGPLVLYAVDDWALTGKMELTPWVRLLLLYEGIGMVRLGPPHPYLTGSVMYLPDIDEWNHWCLLLERHHYAFGHRPALYHRRFLEHYGRFAEGVNAFDCERIYTERFNKSPSGPAVALALPHLWQHVGEMEVGDVVP